MSMKDLQTCEGAVRMRAIHTSDANEHYDNDGYS